MKVITLWQPWATWISLGWKTIETRTHSRFASLQGQRIAIHAGQKYDENAIKSAVDFLTDEQIHFHRIHHHGFRWPHSAIICTAFVCSHAHCRLSDSKLALIECQTERWGLYLRDIELVNPPIHCSGHQGIWSFDL